MNKFSFNNLNVNERLKITLFIEKKVMFRQDIFDSYYNIIFPCPKNFIDFLSASNYEQQLICAKRIISRMFFFNYNSVCFDLFKNLINMEQGEILNQDESYKPRNHSIHSVNTYILGVYLYFCMEIFNTQLSNYFSRFSNSVRGKDSDFRLFIDSWKLFALNHDIGYPMERLVNKSNKYISDTSYEIVKTMNEISKMISNEMSILQIVRFIGISIIQELSKTNLSNRINSLNNWNEKLCKELSKIIDLNSFVKLDGIFSFDTLEFYNIFKSDKICFLITKNSSPVCFVDNKGQNFFFDDKFEIPFCLNYTNHINVTDYSVEYYYPVEELNNILNNFMDSNSHYSNDIILIAKQIIKNNTIEYAEINNHYKYLDFLYEIYCIIKKQIINTSNNISLDIDYYKKIFVNSQKMVLEDMNNFFNTNQKLDINKTVQETVTNEISRLLKEYYANHAYKNVLDFFFSDSKEEKPELKYLYYALFNTFFNQIKNKKSLFWEIKKTSVRRYYDNKDKEFVDFFDRIKNVFSELAYTSDLINKTSDFEKLLDYSDGYNIFDHGMASAYISVEVFYKCKYVFDSLNDYPLPIGYFYNENSLFQSFYSIFVHNMYVSFFEKIGSKPVKHNILKNPFVFFALFCDNMQIWDRPFDVNQGRIDIIKPSIPHEDFLFGIYDNRVYIHCKSADMETVIKNYRKSLDEYLQEASKLIVLGISE